MGVKRGVPFGKASKEKKNKPEPEEQAVPELEIELEEELDDEELSEVYGLFSKLQEERDSRIARGLVHECDRLLRARDEKGEVLPPRFHVAYAGALLTLCDPSNTETESEGLEKAGLERLDTGIEQLNEDLFSAGIAAQELVQFLHTRSENGKLADTHVPLVNKTVELLAKGIDTEIAKAAFQFIQLKDEIDELEQTRQVVNILDKHAESSDLVTKSWAHRGLGSHLLNESAQADTTADDANKVSKKTVENAIEHLQKGLHESSSQSYVLLAEAQLQLAGLLEEMEEDNADKEVEEIYADALRNLKKAQLLGHEGLRDVIESLEEDE